MVQRGQEVILRCHYDLENAPLYSLKWYRGRYEFYRFSPSEDPATKIFNITGIYVDVSHSRSLSLNKIALSRRLFSLSFRLDSSLAVMQCIFYTVIDNVTVSVRAGFGISRCGLLPTLMKKEGGPVESGTISFLFARASLHFFPGSINFRNERRVSRRFCIARLREKIYQVEAPRFVSVQTKVGRARG